MPRPKCCRVWECYNMKTMACGKYVHLCLSCMTLIHKMILFIQSRNKSRVQFQGLYLSSSLYVPWNLLYLDETAEKLCTSLNQGALNLLNVVVVALSVRSVASLVRCKHCIDRPYRHAQSCDRACDHWYADTCSHIFKKRCCFRIKFNNFLLFRGTTSRPNGFEMLILFYNIIAYIWNFLGNG